MTGRSGAEAEKVSAIVVASATSGPHLKHSPSLLFDILTEPDKVKQQVKLQRASIAISAVLGHEAEAPAAAGAATHGSPAQATQLERSEYPQLQQLQCHQAKLYASPQPAPAAPQGLQAAGDPSPGKGPAAGATTTAAGAGREPGPGRGSSQSLLLSEAASAALHPMSLSDVGDAKGPAASGSGADAAEASTRPDHAPLEEPAAGPSAAQPQQAAPPGPAVAPDPLAEFTPRVILQELLGDLFVCPERLTPVGKFGQGAFATVQKCSLSDPTGGPSRLVAVKSLKPEALSDLEDLRRFLLEANLVRKLRHPHIVSLVGLGGWELADLEALRRSAFVVMEGLEGGDLRMAILRQMTCHRPAYSRLDALRWATHIASACAYLHETCRPMVIHRDLKPENVLLTGGPVDNTVAKVTDFGLHKRARATAADVLMAVTHEWSTRGGSAFHHHHHRGGAAAGMGAGGSGRGGNDFSTHGPGGGGGYKDKSYYGGSVHAGNAFAGASMHRCTTNHSIAAAAAAAGPADRSSNARYASVAAAGLAAAAADDPALSRLGSACGSAAGGDGSVKAAAASGGCAAATAAIASANGSHPGPSGGSFTCSDPNDSVRAGTAAAAALGLLGRGSSNGPAGERPRLYLLAHDGRRGAHMSRSKFNSTNDLVAAHDAALAAAGAVGAAGASVAVAPQPPVGLSALQQAAARLSGCDAGGSIGGPTRCSSAAPLVPQQAPADWPHPHVVQHSGGSHEESVRRKMLALMALESASVAAAAAAVGANATAAATPDGSGGSGGGGETGPVSSDSAGSEAAPTAAESGEGTAPFSVTEFVRAAAAVPTDGAGPAGPSAVMLMRSLSLALQQQQQQEQQGDAGKIQADGAAAEAAAATAVSAAPPPYVGLPPRAAARAAAATAMKTVPENNRMSMDLRSASHLRLGLGEFSGGGGSGGSGKEQAAGWSAVAAAAAAAAAASGKGSKGTRQREQLAPAAARMADATRQVGSLIYMAPELFASGSYNEKVDVFSFAIIAFELFAGKLLAIKIANDYAYQQAQSRRGAPTGLGGLPAAATASGVAGRDEAEAGVLAYVARRSGGAREALPRWWPERLRGLIARCWAQDPAERPSFSEIHSELRAMAAEGCLAGMDAADPARGPGCGCTVS